MSDDEKPVAKFLRLQNGDDVIAEVIEIEHEESVLYTLFHPLKVVYMPTESTGYLSVAFMPWVFPRICDQQEFIIHAEDVLLIVDVSEKMNTYYWDSVDTYINKTADKVEEMQEETNMSPEDEFELFRNIMKQFGTKRTLH